MADELKVTLLRNLVVLGKTGVGKSTVVNQILGEPVLEVGSPLASSTRETRILEKEYMDKERRVEYKIKIIDTVGLHQKKDFEEVCNSAQSFPDGINLILFIIRRGCFTEEEIEIFKRISKIKNVKELSALVITGCEELGNHGRKELISEMQSNKITQSFAKSMGKGIYPVGFPNADTLKPALKEVYEEGIKTDAEELRKIVLDSGVMTLLQKDTCTFL